ncbi:MarR family winged helix-turn-helix transcriptional regulator [Agilicoccus flavus]|uniref:MarR family winged helix-turn-helix transcriptional regulator n=1 Tax=Agilicoccus flavus TaxID=2775968 RepID=UPI001CF7181C|nr:MarR family transcriptional regulator [Agilicoccus flavus]
MGTPSKTSAAVGHPVIERVRALSVETQNYVDAVARRLGLHRSDVAAIGSLTAAERAGETVTPGELARRAHLSAAAISAMLDRLERAHHLRRDRHETDGRRVVVDLTPLARRTSRTMFRPLLDAQQETLTGYTAEELDIAARVMADLTEAARVASAGSLPEPPRD